jgi:mRNA deadenylase 3'-5' endonuclease subunit Ccr4
MTNQRFSAATYNILADAYVRPDRYRGSPPEALDPGPRRARLLDRVAALDADVLCLQEVEPEAYQAIAVRLGDGFAGAFARRDGRPDGAAIFARRSCLAWERHETLHYQAHRNNDDQVALVAHLWLGAHRLVVASTHLQWCPDNTPAEEHVGRAQMIELLDHLSRDGAGATWLLAGDLNATSQSPVVAAAIERGLSLGAKTQRPWDTCNANGRPRKLDYLLFTTGHLDPRPGVLPPLRRDTPMPSLSEPSDHLPLRIDFHFVL